MHAEMLITVISVLRTVIFVNLGICHDLVSPCGFIGSLLDTVVAPPGDVADDVGGLILYLERAYHCVPEHSP